MPTARRKARKRALDVLFEAEQRGVDVLPLLAERQAEAKHSAEAYTGVLVEGVVAHRAAIDEMIAQNLAGDWTLERLPSVDRVVLRLAVFELCFGGDVPVAVAVSEAVAMVGDLSTDESPGYVNGVLSALVASGAGRRSVS